MFRVSGKGFQSERQARYVRGRGQMQQNQCHRRCTLRAADLPNGWSVGHTIRSKCFFFLKQ